MSSETEDVTRLIRPLEQLLIIQEKAVDELQKKVKGLHTLIALQAGVNKSQSEINQMYRQQLDVLSGALQTTMSLVSRLSDALFPEKAPPPPRAGVSEVG